MAWFDKCLRCSNCGISYPYSHPVACDVCKEKLDPIQDKHDPDWQQKVALMLAPPPEAVEPEEKVYGWRVKQLVYAGAPYHVAEQIALDREIDLHKAIHLIKTAGPKLAEAILL